MKIFVLAILILLSSCTLDNYTGETKFNWDVDIVNNIDGIETTYRESYGLISIDLENDSEVIIIELLFTINGKEIHIYDYIAPHEVYNIYHKKIYADTSIECEIKGVIFY